MHRIEICDENGTTMELCLSRRFDAHLKNLASELNVTLDDQAESADFSRDRAAGEFA